MTSETQTRELMHRTGEILEIGQPPIDALLASTRRRRRRIAAVAAGLAAAGVVTAVALIASGDDPGSEPISPAQTVPPPATSSPPDAGLAPDRLRIVAAEPACAPNDGPAVLVHIQANRRYDVHVVLSIGDNVIGKLPTKIQPGKRNDVLVDQVEAINAKQVTVQVFGLGMPMATTLLAELPDVSLRPRPLCG